MTVVVDGLDDLTLDHYRRVAFDGEGVAIGPGAARLMAQRRAEFVRLLESDRTQFIYGVTSNFGPRARQVVPPDQQKAHARRTHRGRGSWARGFGGGVLDERVVRGIVFARLANFVSGGAKVRPAVAERVAALLEAPLPPVPLDGEVGAGEVLLMQHVLRHVDRSDLEEGEGNALSNGSPVAAALAADAAVIARSRLAAADAAFAASVAAGRRAPALEPVPVSFLAVAAFLGEGEWAVRAVEHAAAVSLRSVTDNPTFIPPDETSPLGRAVSTGGYHNTVTYPALNQLAAAWADLAVVAGRHVAALRRRDGAPVGGDDPAAALPGLLEELRAEALPTLLPAAVNDPQDDVSAPALGAWRRAGRAGELLDRVLAVLAGEAGAAPRPG